MATTRMLTSRLKNVETRLKLVTPNISNKPIQQNLPPLPRTKDLLHIYGLKAKKNLSQNFLLKSRLLRGLVRAAGIQPGHRVIEVGPGPGNLSKAILERAPAEVIAIEKDRRFLPLLEQLADSVLPGQFKILIGDALEHEFGNAFQMSPLEWHDSDLPPIRIIGNLPFSVAIPLMIKWLEFISLHKSFWEYGRTPLLLTFQEEVARRICANPTAYERTRLSAMAQNYCHVEYKHTISGKSFTPMAAVNTGVVKFTPRKTPYCSLPFRLFEKLNRHLFHHRNHPIDYNFSKLFPRDMYDLALEIVNKSRVNPKIYPFMLSNVDVARLANVYYEECKKVPALIEYNYRASKKLESQGTLKVLEQANLLLLDSQ